MSKKMKKITAIILLSISTGAAHATQSNNRLSPQFNACMEKADSLESKYKCYSTEDALQKKKLNAAYNRIARHSDPSDLPVLNKVQKSWITWRDETYHYLSDHAGDVAETNFAITEGFMLDAIVDQTDLLNGIADSRGF